MGITSALDWWEEWKLRVLVLASLLVYYILNFSYTVRSLPNLRRLRVVIWIAYIGSDALAIYALATLFNRHKQTATRTTATALEVTWVPALLIHLGGHPAISAYSLEDNELWKRHVITFVSQVTVALYVFCKWWSGETRLLQAAVLLFVVGVLKFGQKPWALKNASFNSMLDSVPVSLRRGRGREERDLSLQEYVREANRCVLNTTKAAAQQDETSNMAALLSSAEVVTSNVAGYTNNMFIDMSAPYLVRLSELRSFMQLDHKRAHDKLQRCLTQTFGLLYSRMRSSTSPLGILLGISIPSISIASVVLLAKSNMDGYDRNDVRVTYILYCGNAIMEFLPLFLTFMFLPFKCCRPFYARRWHDMVAQCSLMSFCVRKRKLTVLMKLAAFGFLRDFINMHWYIQQKPVAGQITSLVRQHVRDGWEHEIGADASRYKRFSNLGRFDAQLRSLGWSSSVPFDHRVLLWHIATDLCFHQPDGFHHREEDTHTRRSRSREISNYMMYLLSARPEMLMSGTTPGLLAIAGNEIELILNQSNNDTLLDTEESLAREIIRVVTPATATYSVIHDACGLAKALLKLGDAERWTVIQRMWVEMLCYSAVRCRGYLHARSLGDGGECLTSVWLLWSFMGMETLADMLQRPQPSLDGDGDGCGAPPASQSQ